MNKNTNAERNIIERISRHPAFWFIVLYTLPCSLAKFIYSDVIYKFNWIHKQRKNAARLHSHHIIFYFICNNNTHLYMYIVCMVGYLYNFVWTRLFIAACIFFSYVYYFSHWKERMGAYMCVCVASKNWFSQPTIIQEYCRFTERARAHARDSMTISHTSLKVAAIPQ